MNELSRLLIIALCCLSSMASHANAFNQSTAECLESKNYLSISFESGHADNEFYCDKCQNGLSFYTTPSLYPAYITNLDDWIDLFPGALGDAAIHTYYMLKNVDGSRIDHSLPIKSSSSDAVTYELTDEQANRLFAYLQTLSPKTLQYKPFTYNCVDFAKSLFDATGLEGSMLDGFSHDKPLNIFHPNGNINLAATYAYYRTYGLNTLISAVYEQCSNWEKLRRSNVFSDNDSEEYLSSLLTLFSQTEEASKKPLILQLNVGPFVLAIDDSSSHSCPKNMPVGYYSSICVSKNSKLRFYLMEIDTENPDGDSLTLADITVNIKTLGKRNYLVDCKDVTYNIEIDLLSDNKNEAYILKVNVKEVSS